MVMKICPKWKMDSAAELAVKNWYVQTKTESYPLTGVSISGGPLFRRRTLEHTLGDTSGDTLGTPRASASSWASQFRGAASGSFHKTTGRHDKA